MHVNCHLRLGVNHAHNTLVQRLCQNSSVNHTMFMVGGNGPNVQGQCFTSDIRTAHCHLCYRFCPLPGRPALPSSSASGPQHLEISDQTWHTQVIYSVIWYYSHIKSYWNIPVAIIVSQDNNQTNLLLLLTILKIKNIPLFIQYK